MNTVKRTRDMVMMAALVAIMLLMTVVPVLGYIPLGFMNATIIHIPVIVGAILLGPKKGAVLGLVFGFTSMWKNTALMPNLTSFVFTPFITMPDGGSGGRKNVKEIPLPDIDEYTPEERMLMEKETTGLYLSGHPMDQYREAVRRLGAPTIGSILGDFAQEGGPTRFADDQRITICGIVTSSKTKTTRNNSLMAYVTVEDDTASIELLCFARVLESCGPYLKENQAVVVKGRLSVREEKAPQILCDSAYPLSAAGAPAAEGQAAKAPDQVLYLKFPSLDHPSVRHMKLVFQMFPGNAAVKMVMADTRKVYGTHASLHEALLQEARETLGEANVVVK